MNGAAVVADVVAGQRAHDVSAPPLPYSLLSYNISLNLSSIFNMLPASRFLARWKIGNLGNLLDPPDLPTASLVDDWAASDSTTFASATTSMAIPAAVTPPELDQLSAFPGPWGFFTSWYMLGLLFMVRCVISFPSKYLSWYIGCVTSPNAEPRNSLSSSTAISTCTPCLPIWSNLRLFDALRCSVATHTFCDIAFRFQPNIYSFGPTPSFYVPALQNAPGVVDPRFSNF